MSNFQRKIFSVTLKIFGNMQNDSRLDGPCEYSKVEYSMVVTFLEISTITGDSYLWARIVDTASWAIQIKHTFIVIFTITISNRLT